MKTIDANVYDSLLSSKRNVAELDRLINYNFVIKKYSLTKGVSSVHLVKQCPKYECAV